MLRREREERAKHNFQPKFATSTTVESAEDHERPDDLR